MHAARTNWLKEPPMVHAQVKQATQARHFKAHRASRDAHVSLKYTYIDHRYHQLQQMFALHRELPCTCSIC